MEYYLPKMPCLEETVLPIEDEDLKDFKPIKSDSNNKIAIIMTHFLRDKLLLISVKSIFEHHPGVKIYIADQGVYNSNSEKFYKLMRNAGHEVIYVGYDAGISRCRNLLVKTSKESYIYWQDDDDIFLPETDLNRGVKILENNRDIGIVGMLEYTKEKINHYEMNLNIKDDMIYYSVAWNSEETRKNFFSYCDMTINACIAKREIFDEVLLDERMKLAEHLDFFLQVKYFTNWKVCYADIYIKHQDVTIADSNYTQFRNRNRYFWQYYIHKWNINCLHNLEFKSNRPYKIELIKQQDIIKQEKSVEPTKIESSSISKEVSITEEEKAERILKQLIDILNIEKISYSLIDRTCSEIVCEGKVKTLPMTLWIEKTTPELLNKLKLNNFSFFNDTITKNYISINIYYSKTFKETKKYECNKYTYLVPIPVVSYLKKLRLWKE